MFNLNCNTKNHLIIALIFATAMLLCSWLMRDHENSAAVFIGLISTYPILARVLQSKRATRC